MKQTGSFHMGGLIHENQFENLYGGGVDVGPARGRHRSSGPGVTSATDHGTSPWGSLWSTRGGQPVWPTGAGLRATCRSEHRRVGLDGPNHAVAKRADETCFPRHDGRRRGGEPAEASSRNRPCLTSGPKRTPAASRTTAARAAGKRATAAAIRTLSASMPRDCTCGHAIPKSATRSRPTRICPPPGGQTSPSIPIQTSPIAVLDQDYSAGFRAGFGVCLDACSEIGASYTWFDTSVENSITATDVALSMITRWPCIPPPRCGHANGLEAAGRHDLQFDLIDIDYRSYLVQTCTSSLDYVIGVR